MFVVPAIVLLVSLIFLKPQEYFTALQAVPLLYLSMALTIIMVLVDFRLRLIRAVASPQLKWVLIFIGWALVTVALRAPQALVGTAIGLLITFMPYLTIAHGIQGFRQLHIIAATYFVLTLFLAIVGVHQNFQPLECVSFAGSESELRPRDSLGALADGTECGRPEDCSRNNPEPGYEYGCERRGVFNTCSTGGGRVRYRGQLKDPNELALTVSSGLPFAIGLYLVDKTPLRLLMLLVMLVLGTMAVKFTQSRGGLMVFGIVALTYAVQRYGKKALIIGAVLMIPMMAVLGGQKRADADDSKEERLELQQIGIEAWKLYPLRGVGYQQYTEYHERTTHNSYILVLAEVGVPGGTIWATIIFMSFKAAVRILTRYRDREEARVARIWATVSISSMAGLCVGIFFLSFYSHFIPWILVGVNGAMNLSVAQHDPTWSVDVKRREVALIALGTLFFGVAASVILPRMHA